jgi:hypothetical protein
LQPGIIGRGWAQHDPIQKRRPGDTMNDQPLDHVIRDRIRGILIHRGPVKVVLTDDLMLDLGPLIAAGEAMRASGGTAAWDAEIQRLRTQPPVPWNAEAWLAERRREGRA